MKWNCPHCGVALSVPDEKLNANWTFSRCYQCSGFALVKKPELNLIKVDQPPQDLKIPPMNQSATQHLAEVIQKAPVSPKILPSQRHPQPEPPKKMITLSPPQPPSPPSPLQPHSNKVLPLLMVIASFSALGSGVYLYRQGKKMIARASLPPAPVSAPVPVVHEIKTQLAAPERQTPNTTANTSPAASQFPGMVVRPKSSQTLLRQGPGDQFKELGFANPELQYIVTEWKDRWFKVIIQDSRQTAWVRNDQVVLTPVAGL